MIYQSVKVHLKLGKSWVFQGCSDFNFGVMLHTYLSSVGMGRIWPVCVFVCP